jgi:hypothetical protein
VHDTEPVRRVAELRDRHHRHPRDLGGVDRRDGVHVRPPGQHRRDHEAGRRKEDRRQLGDDAHCRRVQPDLLLGLAQRRRDVVGVGGVDGATREGDLPGVRAHVGGALDEQHARPVVGVGERDEHGRRASAAVGGGQEPGQLRRPDLAGGRRERPDPVRQLLDRHHSMDSIICEALRTSLPATAGSVGPSP